MCSLNPDQVLIYRFQFKHLNGSFQSQMIRQIRGFFREFELGLNITTGKFSKGSMKEASKSNKSRVVLLDGEQLLKLLMENEFRVHWAPCDLFELTKLPSSVFGA